MAHKIFNCGYSIMALLLIVSFVYYDIQVIRKGRELLGLPRSFSIVFRELLPLRSIPSLGCFFAATFTGQFFLFYSIALIIFIVFNIKGVKLVKKYAKTLFTEPTVVNI
ncbi:MAG: hypothetical protein JNL60_12680 [Bacteroidia bacterium]|nr:hypothetical protein [Bacteroidia bacterium]